MPQRESEAFAALRHDLTLDPARLDEVTRRAVRSIARPTPCRLWAEDKFSYSGTFFRFDEVTLGEARPAATPPVLVAAGIDFPLKPGAPVHHGWTEKHAGTFVLGPYKRVAAYGDGWMTVHLKPEEYDLHWAKIQAHSDAAYGGKPVAKAFNCFVNVDPDPEGAPGGQGSLGGFPRSADLG